MASEKVAEEIGNCVRGNLGWQQLPHHLRTVLHHNQRDYEKYVFNYSLKNQLRYRGNLVAKVFKNELRYYELLIQKNINGLGVFPYHLADIITKGLRVTPFNYYLDVLSQLLRNDKSYDTLPNFTAADCLRVLGIGRNEYLALVSDLKTHTPRTLLFSVKPNPLAFLPQLPVRIHIEHWWQVHIGHVLETDIQMVSLAERSLLDDLIDFGAQPAYRCDYEAVHSLYRKGLIYLDVPICGEDRICIPPLRNFVMNRVSGDYFENLLYKIFVSADEHMTISELAQMLQLDLESVKQAVRFFCRLGFAQRKQPMDEDETTATQHHHSSWLNYNEREQLPQTPQITPLTYIPNVEQPPHSPKTPSKTTPPDKDSSSIGYLSSDGNTSDFSFANVGTATTTPTPTTNHHHNNNSSDSSELEEVKPIVTTTTTNAPSLGKSGPRVGFLFDSTLTAFLMMGNLSPGLKNHAVTMFEVGKLSEESMDSFLAELEQVSLLDAEGEGDVSRYFAHAIILRSTICSVRHLLPGGLDLLRLECLEGLDKQTRDRVLEKKYKFIISATPLTAQLTNTFGIPFFGQFVRSCDVAPMWMKLFYNHISGYGPPSILLCRGTVLKSLPRLFLGYGKLLVNILHSDAYVLNSENFRNLNDQLKHGCILVQGYGIRTSGELHYESFPFQHDDMRQAKWAAHRAVQELAKCLDMEHQCGYITFLNTGVADLGCEEHEMAVKLRLPQRGGRRSSSVKTSNVPNVPVDNISLLSPGEVTSYQLKTPDENHFATTPPPTTTTTTTQQQQQQEHSPSNEFTSADCTEVLASELAKCPVTPPVTTVRGELVSQSSIEIPIEVPPAAAAAAVSPPLALSSHHPGEGDVEEAATEQWTLLDVNFGVPLFDVDTNTRICEHLVRELCTDENLRKLPECAKQAESKLLEFVRQCMFFEDDPTTPAQVMEPLKASRPLPYPRINLAFENGRVGYWSGR